MNSKINEQKKAKTDKENRTTNERNGRKTEKRGT